MNRRIILASQSPRRKQLLEWAEQKFEVVAANTDEQVPVGMEPAQVAVHIAKEKAEAVGSVLQDAEAIIIAADTIVVLGDKIIGKPSNREEAISILNQLSGNRHQVITGVVILRGTELVEFADTTEVSFHSLSNTQIEYYVDHYKPYDKAGAYAIQEWIGVVGIQNINGDFYNVMGLPVSRVIQALATFS